MQNRILVVLIAMAAAGSACAQEPPPPPPGAAPPPAPAPAANITPAYATLPVPLADALPPLPPGCITAAPPPPQPPLMPATDVAFETALNLSSAQAAQVRRVFERRAARQARLDDERRALDAETCRDLRGIVGDQGLARWWSSMPGPRGPAGPRIAPPPPPGG